jgi:prepilin-type N-terminal cleavage/methylation domain-containing protein
MNKGFTLLEVIVATAIFSMAVSSISALFMVAVRTQRNVLAQQDLIDNTRYALEHMSRQIRMARRDESKKCVGEAGYTFTAGGSSLKFVDYRGDCLTYDVEDGKIRLKLNKENPVDLTSDDIRVNSLNFEVIGRWAYDVEQPRVIIYLDAEAAGAMPESSPQILLQTTVSVRNIDTP